MYMKVRVRVGFRLEGEGGVQAGVGCCQRDALFLCTVQAWMGQAPAVSPQAGMVESSGTGPNLASRATRPATWSVLFRWLSGELLLNSGEGEGWKGSTCCGCLLNSSTGGSVCGRRMPV
jgi:hypothetical protein